MSETKENIPLTTFEKLKNIRALILSRTMMGYVYKESWGSEFRLREIDEIPEVVGRWDTETDKYTQIQPSDLTIEEMLELGFRRFSSGSDMFLIPIWVFPFLADEIYVECIDKTKGILKKSEIDTDTRYGLLAYGVIPKKS